MTGDPYPILVERLSAEQAFGIACYACGHTWRAPDVDDFIKQIEYCGHCERCNSPKIGPQYEPGMRCPNCQKLAMEFPKSANGCCSRVCMLQWEYAQQLAARGATA